jgi:hypothetical protein
MEGLNWLLYNFHQKKNVILADEMGLGKTIQIISLFASLVKGNPKVCPIPHYFGTLLMSSVLALPCSDSKLDVSKLAPRNQEMGAGTTCCHLLWR